ncbi:MULTISPECIES: glycosyltransferase family 2 protein [unclassified Wenzhouxiangella]|uniref:glycosyltransferase family 2 protein n=1 Tax=unclassified Wenzhouxiangella TaxID=2613841 RepID=UPI000E32C602|nr:MULTISPECIES: glycosyltransferase family 2 protein [unclassified Wenzhouxiangella]RFF27876.1 glycosyltransferase [Wenzhouxiangella sp. 15181]RFP68997.1 glycosyltransferase [Wenzhouxiangella sp. 15190]
MKISIVTVTFNALGTIQDCLNSIDAQDGPDIERIVIDGASKDGTLDLLRRRESHIDTIISEPDEGIYDALNKGINLASGDVIGFLHADDVLASASTLSRIARSFTNPSVSAVYGDLQYVHPDETDRVVRYWQPRPFSLQRLKWGWMPPHPTLYVRREWYDRIGRFDTSYSIAADYHHMLRLFGHPDFRAVYIPKVLVKMRVGGASNKSIGNIIRKSQEDLRALQETGVGALGGYGALAWKNLSKLGQFWNRK